MSDWKKGYNEAVLAWLQRKLKDQGYEEQDIPLTILEIDEDVDPGYDCCGAGAWITVAITYRTTCRDCVTYEENISLATLIKEL